MITRFKIFERKEDIKIDNMNIVNFAKIYNKEKGYSNKEIFYSNSSKYVSVVENPYDNFNNIIVGDLALRQFIRNAKYDGMSDSLFMRALTNKVNQKYGNNKVIIVSDDVNIKFDTSKPKDSYDNVFRPIDSKQIEKIMNNVNIIEEGTLNVNKEGEVIKPNTKGDTWTIKYKESDDYIFANFGDWDIIMKEDDFISKFMEESEYLLNVSKYNL